MEHLPNRIRYHGTIYVLAGAPAQKLKPNDYRKEHGFCPDGFHWDGKNCVGKDKPKLHVIKDKKPSAQSTLTAKTFKGTALIPAMKLDRLHTKAGKRLHIQIGPKAKVYINPDYDAKKDDTYYAMSFPPGSLTGARHYTHDFVVRNRNKKFAHLPKLAKKMPDIRKKYSEDLKSDDPNKKYYALAVALVDQALFRVGNAKSEKERGVQGIHNLQIRNVKLGKDGRAEFDYVGKHKVQQHHLILDKRLTKLVKELIKGKGKNDYLFSWQNKGKTKHMSPQDLNSYFKESLGSPASIHKVRSYHATQMANQALKEPPKDIHGDKKAAMKWFKSQIDPISKKLGHKNTTTTLNHYIDPAIVSKFFKGVEVGVPKTILATSNVIYINRVTKLRDRRVHEELARLPDGYKIKSFTKKTRSGQTYWTDGRRKLNGGALLAVLGADTLRPHLGDERVLTIHGPGLAPHPSSVHVRSNPPIQTDSEKLLHDYLVETETGPHSS